MKLVCAICKAEGLPDPVCEIRDDEVVYATEDGEPACEACGEAHNLSAMDRPPWQ